MQTSEVVYHMAMVRGPEDTPPTRGVALSTDLADPTAIPYFLWDEPMTVQDLRARLSSASPPERLRLLAKVLREARDTEVWLFTNPQEVAQAWPLLAPRLGRRAVLFGNSCCLSGRGRVGLSPTGALRDATWR